MHTVEGGGIVACDIFLIGGFSRVWQFVTEGEGSNLVKKSVTYFFEWPLIIMLPLFVSTTAQRTELDTSL